MKNENEELTEKIVKLMGDQIDREQETIQEIEDLFQKQMDLDMLMKQDLKTGWSHLILTDGFIERQEQMSDEFINLVMQSATLKEQLPLDMRTNIMNSQEHRREVAMTEEFGDWWQEQKEQHEESINKAQKLVDENKD